MSVSTKFTVSHVYSLFRSVLFANPNKIQLGRWTIQNKQNEVDLKVMYSNEDHCGICKGYMTTKNIDSIVNDPKKEEQLNEELILLISCTPDK